MSLKSWMIGLGLRLRDSSREDEGPIDAKLSTKLAARKLPSETSNNGARLAIKVWDDAHSMPKIREAYSAQNWSQVVELVAKRTSVRPDEVKSHLFGARAFYMLKDWSSCTAASEAVLALEPDNVEALRFMARCAKNQDRSDAAIDYYQRVIERSPDDLGALLGLVRLYHRQRNPERVRHFAHTLVAADPRSRDGHLYLARSSMILDQLPIALASLATLLEMDQDDVDAVLEMGRIKFKLNEPEEARSFLERVLELNPGERRAERTLATVYERLKDWERAGQALAKECEIEPMLYRNWERRINALYGQNREADAKASLDHLFELVGETLGAFLMAAAISESFCWDQMAESYFKEATQRWGGEVDLHTTIASRALDSGDLTHALVHIRKGQDIAPESAALVEVHDRFSRMLAATRTPLAEVATSIEDGTRVLHAECAIRNLVDMAANVEVRPARKSDRKVVIVSSSLGRGGAERQVVTCLAGLVNETSVKDVDLFCDALDKTGGRFPTYAPEIAAIGVRTHEFIQREKWNETYQDVVHLLEPWRDALEQLPPRMRRQVEPLYLAFVSLKPDVVHAWQDITNINVAVAALMAGVPGIVLFARSLRPDRKTMMYNRNSLFVRRAYHAVLEHPNVLLCHNSEVGAQSYGAWLDLPSDAFPVIHNGVDFDSIATDSEDADLTATLAQLGIPEDATVIGSVFRFVLEKQPRLWVDTVARVMKERPDVHAVVVGRGGLMKDTKSYIEECGLSDRIHLVGHSRQIKAWLDVFDIFLLTSRIEGLPNVLMEAQAFGVPVVSTDAGGSRDTYIDGETGVLVLDHSPETLSRAILERLDDKTWMTNATIRAVEFARNKFSPTTMIRRLMEIYELSLSTETSRPRQN